MEAPLRPRVPRRQAWLFLVAILVPCLVVVGLGLRLMQQERQLQDRRLVDERQRLVVQVRLDHVLPAVYIQEAIKAGAPK